MKENNEFEEKDLSVDDDIQIDDSLPESITVYLETWFDVDKKFGLNTKGNDDMWVNLYGIYNPFKDTIKLKYYVETSSECIENEYIPTESEKELVKKMITEKIQKQCNQTPKEFCLDFMKESNELTMGELK